MLPVLIAVLPLFVSAQFTANYTPYQKTSEIPAAFIFDPVDAARKNIEANKILSPEEAKAYYRRMIFFKDQLFQSGQLYLNNDITRYVDSVASNLLVSEPKLKSDVRIFLTRFTPANAFCFPDGSIFINIGLLAAVQNETELAFVLAHEIAHYAEQHNVKDVRRLAEIQKAESNFYNKNSSLFRSLKFSRESEFDADAWAAQLISQAGYNPAFAGMALTRLKSNETNKSTLEFKKYFDNAVFQIDTIWYGNRAVRRHKSQFDAEDDDPVTSGKLNDLFQTHPDIDKRIEAVDLIAKSIKKKNDNAIGTASRFDRLHETALFEQVENNYLGQDYLNAIIGSIRLLEKYPDNAYLHEIIAKSLYWLSYYKEISDGDINITGNKEEGGGDFYKLYALMNEMGLKDAKKMAYAYIISRYEKYPDHEPSLFYMAVSAENYLGKNAAKNYYRDYITKYPSGKFSAVTKAKLQ